MGRRTEMSVKTRRREAPRSEEGPPVSVLYATGGALRPRGCMPTHSRFALFLPALALVGCTQSMPGEPGDPALTALYNRGDGSFKSADDGNFHVGLVADLNGDGRTDLVGWSSLGAAPLTVEMTQPGGNSSAAESSPSLPFDLIYNS